MRYIYTTLFYLFTPIILLRLYWRGFKAPDYRKRWMERLSIYKVKQPTNVIWIHAVSVGESEAVFPLIRLLQKQYPDDYFLVTTTTPTGSKRVIAELKSSVTHVYLPYDLPIVVSRFLTAFKPKIAIFMEKEIWPNLYRQCFQHKISISIINARLSANSAKGYQKISRLIQPALSVVSNITAQTDEDKQRFIDIGAKAETVEVAGNLKFDIQIDNQTIQLAKDLKKKLFADRYVWIIASTHKGEEAIFFELYIQLKQKIPELLLLVVPRHPERFVDVKTLAERKGLITCMRSTHEPCGTEIDVYVADTMGELKLLYGVADMSFVGGSMVPVGGHNILEPAAMNVPVTFGCYMVNSKNIAEDVVSLGAGIQCADRENVMRTVLHLYHTPQDKEKMVANMSEFLKNNQGATEITRDSISKLLAKTV